MENNNAIPRWSLQELFPSPDGPEIRRAFKELDKRVAALEKQRRRLTPRISPAAFLALVKELELARALARRVASFAELFFSENTQDPVAMTFYANTEQRLAELGNRLLFFSTWWKDLPKAAALRLLAHSGPYRYFLEQMRRFRPGPPSFSGSPDGTNAHRARNPRGEEIHEAETDRRSSPLSLEGSGTGGCRDGRRRSGCGGGGLQGFAGGPEKSSYPV